MSYKDEKEIFEKDTLGTVEVLPPGGHDAEAVNVAAHNDIHATKQDIEEAEAALNQMPVERARKVLSQVYLMHKHDQNFDTETLHRMQQFLEDPEVVERPEDYQELIHAMRLEAILVTNNSPYAIVRGVVDPDDDPSMPALTIRVWIIGCLMCGIFSVINQLFTIRYPSILVSSSVVQLLSFPLGKLLERSLPNWTFTVFGRRLSTNPGPFNKKEHMLITIMSNTGIAVPYTTSIIFVQALPKWFNQGFAMNFSYQLLNTMGCQLCGYGLAGLCRTFLVYPSYCVWPSCMSTLALNKGFHSDEASVVPGPGKKMYSWSRMKLFYVSFGAMFVYFWFPNTIFQKLTVFNWIAWIKPDSPNLTRATSLTTGLGINPFPTLDWNYGFLIDTPAFAVISAFFGLFISMFMIIGFYFTNAFNCAYLPLTSNGTYDNKAKPYNVTRILTKEAQFDPVKYQSYSEPYMAASNITNYFFFFAKYTGILTYIPLYHRHEIALGFKMLWRNLTKAFRKKDEAKKEVDADALGEDVHFRLMRANYKEVSEWWYLGIICLSLLFGMLGVGLFPTQTSPAVVVYGIIMAMIFMLPLGIVMAVTGDTPTLNVLAEFIGGCFAEGNALQMNYFKMYGYVTAAHAVTFSKDLKLGHYTKIPPRYTFVIQIAGALINCFVTSGIMNYQLHIKNVCSAHPPNRFYCIDQTTFFTATVFWGTLGPRKIFGSNGRFKYLTFGFLFGPALVLGIYAIQKMRPRSKMWRSVHAIALLDGAFWYPTTLGEYWSYVWTTMLSWWYVKGRYLAFWSKYNYILSAGLTAGVAISALIQFFALGFLPDGVEFPVWWGNADEVACNVRNTATCSRLKISPDIGYFGPPPGQLH